MKNNKNLVVLNDNAQFNLLNVKNYNTNIECSVDNIIARFSTIILDYIIVTSEKLNIKNNKYFQFIFERGLETIIHVFEIIFYYTKNIELTYQQCQKAYLYYIEFIEQISDENVSFLQLSSRDAVLFVYKKTIYEINVEYIKNLAQLNKEQQNILILVNTHISIYKSIIIHLLKGITDAKIDNASTRGHKMNSIHNFITNMTTLIKKYKIKPDSVDILKLFVSYIIEIYIESTVFYNLIEEFIKKQHKLPQINIIKMKQNINNSKIKNYIENKQYQKFISYIFED
jgi:hypothetical protein